MVNEALINEVVRRLLDKLNSNAKDPALVVAGVSNRHLHLTAVDVETLFGKGYTLTKVRDLRQPGQYACKEPEPDQQPHGLGVLARSQERPQAP